MSYIGIFAIAILAGLAMGYVLHSVYSARASRVTFPTTDDEMMVSAAEKAVARARSRYGVDLDFTIASLRGVEVVMARVHDEYRAEPQLIDVNSTAFVFGAYIGETIRRTQAAVWLKQEADFVLHLKSAECKPVEWCVNRILRGEEANVAAKYEAMTQPKRKAAGAS